MLRLPRITERARNHDFRPVFIWFVGWRCYAKATFRKDRRLNIRLSSKDLEAIQKRALAEGLPYQTLISSLLHKYASGRLKEV